VTTGTEIITSIVKEHENKKFSFEISHRIPNLKKGVSDICTLN